MNSLQLNEKSYPVYWIDNFLSKEEIEKIINYSKNIQEEEGKVGGNVEAKNNISYILDYYIKNPNVGKVPRVRNCIIKWISLEKNTNWIYQKIISEINKVNQKNYNFILKYVEDLQFTEYNATHNGFYSKHKDCECKRMSDSFIDIRKLSFSIQLSDKTEYEGGELIIYDDEKKFAAPKNKGTIIFFESDMIHEVKPVKSGTRYALVSWVCGPNIR
jgi:PKHD-type hydroxylase